MNALTVVDIVGFAAFILNVAGNFMLIYKERFGWWGWAVRIVSIVCWFAYGVGDASWPNIANAVAFFGINCWGVWKWRKERVRTNATST